MMTGYNKRRWHLFLTNWYVSKLFGSKMVDHKWPLKLICLFWRSSPYSMHTPLVRHGAWSSWPGAMCGKGGQKPWHQTEVSWKVAPCCTINHHKTWCLTIDHGSSHHNTHTNPYFPNVGLNDWTLSPCPTTHSLQNFRRQLRQQFFEREGST